MLSKHLASAGFFVWHQVVGSWEAQRLGSQTAESHLEVSEFQVSNMFQFSQDLDMGDSKK